MKQDLQKGNKSLLPYLTKSVAIISEVICFYELMIRSQGFGIIYPKSVEMQLLIEQISKKIPRYTLTVFVVSV